MTLSKETLEKIAEIDKIRATLFKATRELSRMVHDDTDGLFDVCTAIENRSQLFNNRGSKQIALDAIRDLADDGDVQVKWTDDEDHQICYKFKIDRHDFCVVLEQDKEEA